MPRLIIFFILLLSLAACNSISTRKKGEGLTTAMDEYVAALRWGRFDSAMQYHRNRDDTIPEFDSGQLEYIRVTGHTIKSKTVNEALDEAKVKIEMQYYHNEYGTLKKTVFDQTWWYDDTTKGWYLSSDFPSF